MERFQRPILLSIIIGIALYFGALFLGDYEATKASFAKVPWYAWLIILGLSLFNYLLRYVRWDWFIRDLSGIRISHRLHLSYYLAGFALSTTPGKAGESVRSFYLKRHGVPFNQSISTLFVERLMDLLAIVILSVLAAYYFEDYRIFLIITVIVIFSSLPLIHSRKVLTALENKADSLSGKWASAGAHFVKLLESSAMLLKNKQLYGGMLLGIVAWGAEGIGFWYTLDVLGQDVEWMMAASVYGIAVLVGALSFLPGGLGSTELVMGLLLVALGVDEGVAVAATLICRIATLWFAVFIGIGVAGALAMKGVSPAISEKEVEEQHV
ncbi:MAG: lysylphosphatidylglycerol synthase transmembrane domain-containing protein [Ketobacteraceae bacterium]|nr:lysylphosphatidylglycerol synthase transmembrane domain-containing protein [Ketobacteraceae bacterium]